MFFKILKRKKILNSETITDTRLARVLSCLDLTYLGIGSTLGVGVYVLAGKIAKDSAGPAVILSFFIAAVASFFAGLCYAEFGSRVPKAGSAYIYSYVCVGEFLAFIIGWNLILEYVIGAASVARGFSLYLDTMLNDTLKNTFIDIAPINIPSMSSYFDFFSFGCVLLLAIALAFGLKESAIVNNIFTTVNILVVIFVIIAGSINADIHNWKLPAPTNVTNGGSGGFFPHGFSGVLKGAATCFYGFIGFDCIATTGEEVRNPQKSIPIAILLSLIVVFLSYFGTSAVITLMVPYYLEDINAPIPHAFDVLNMSTAKWIVTIGGMFGLSASLYGAMFPLPRIIYAMASDGLIFKFLGVVHSRFSTPVTGTIIAGLLTGLMGAMFELDQLVDMMSIGTLLAYTIVAACVLLLRYGVNEDVEYTLIPTSASSSVSDCNEYTENSSLTNQQTLNSDNLDLLPVPNNNSIIKQIFNYDKLKIPTATSKTLVTWEIIIYCVLCILIGLGAKFLPNPISHGEVWAIVLISIVGFCTIMVLTSIGLQPHSQEQLSFKVPLIPLIPALSILCNIYLMLMLDNMTWIRFGVWILIGIPIFILTVRRYPKAQNNNVKLNNQIQEFVNGTIQAPKENGYVEKEQMISIPKQRNSLTEDAVIANLDKILLNEEENFKYSSCRKISVDTVSLHSNAFCKEDVVAIVHREDDPNSPLNVVPNVDITYPIPEESNETTVTIDEENFNEIELHNEELPSIPAPPSMQNFEVLLKTATMPAMKIKTVPKLKDVYTLNTDLATNNVENERSLLHKEELPSIPAPPSMQNFEVLLKTATMPSMKVKTVPKLKDVYALSTDNIENEHTLVQGTSELDKFKSQLEKALDPSRNTIHIPNRVVNKTTPVFISEAKEDDDNTTPKNPNDFREELEALHRKKIDIIQYKRNISESGLQKNNVLTNDNHLIEQNNIHANEEEIIDSDSKRQEFSSDVEDDTVHNKDNVKKELEAIFSKNLNQIVKNTHAAVDVNKEHKNATIDNSDLNKNLEDYNVIYGVKLKRVGDV